MKNIFGLIIYLATGVSFFILLLTVLGIIFALIYTKTESVLPTLFFEILILGFISLPFYKKKSRMTKKG